MSPAASLSALFDRLRWHATDYRPESEGADYAAHTFRLQDQTVAYRQARITPKKVGLFVTLWRRSGTGPIRPLESGDSLAGAIIAVDEHERSGLFVFPFAALEKHGVASTGTREGKRALRVYPPWTTCMSAQAERTQRWQVEYFLQVGHNGDFDAKRGRKLFADLGC
jgi:hypothetical protein